MMCKKGTLILKAKSIRLRRPKGGEMSWIDWSVLTVNEEFLKPRVPWWKKVSLEAIGEPFYLLSKEPRLKLNPGYEPRPEDNCPGQYLGWTIDPTVLNDGDRIVRYFKTARGYCFQSYRRQILENGRHRT